VPRLFFAVAMVVAIEMIDLLVARWSASRLFLAVAMLFAIDAIVAAWRFEVTPCLLLAGFSLACTLAGYDIARDEEV
jgi:hypothetical protein